MTETPRHTGFTRVRAVPPADRVDRDGSALVLVGTSVVRLSSLAVAALDGCGHGWTDPADLADGLVTRFGRAESDAVSSTRVLLLALADEGLLELQPPTSD